MRKQKSDNAMSLSGMYQAGMTVDIGLSDEFLPVVAQLREKHQIIPPHDRHELEHNLRLHPIEQMQEEVEGVLCGMEWPDDYDFLNYYLHPKPLTMRVLRMLLPRKMVDTAAGNLKILGQAYVRLFAEPLAHYVVGAPIAIPPPFRFPFQLVMGLDTRALCGDAIVMAVATRFSQPTEVAEQLVTKWQAVFRPGEDNPREKPSGNFVRDSWIAGTYEAFEKRLLLDPVTRDEDQVRALSEQLDEPLLETSRYLAIAEMLPEAFPDEEFPDDPAELLPKLRQARHRMIERCRKIVARANMLEPPVTDKPT